MLVNCPICSEILLPSDVLYSTPCGHIFHVSCLTRWISRWEISSIFPFFVYFFRTTTQIPIFLHNFTSSNTTCPQCRQECSSTTIHRIYLPEVNFQDNDSLIERMNDINRQKIEYENKLKKIEQEKRILETDLKRRKKEFHKVVQRSIKLRKKGKNLVKFRFKANFHLLPPSPARRHRQHSTPTSQTLHRQCSARTSFTYPHEQESSKRIASTAKEKAQHVKGSASQSLLSTEAHRAQQ